MKIRPGIDATKIESHFFAITATSENKKFQKDSGQPAIFPFAGCKWGISKKGSLYQTKQVRLMI